MWGFEAMWATVARQTNSLDVRPAVADPVPNPFRMISHVVTMPDGRVMGLSNAVDIDSQATFGCSNGVAPTAA